MTYASGKMLTIKFVQGAILITNAATCVCYRRKLSKKQLLWFALQALQAAMTTKESDDG